MTAEARAEAVREGRIRRNTETILAVLLGLVSIGVAYASFQAALYDGRVQQSNTSATTLSAEAQALYIEGNQQWVQDAQLFDTLTNFSLDAQNPDAAIAAAAQIKYDTLYFQSVYPEFDAAIQWADEQNAADPELWYSPLDNEDYLNYLYSGYDEVQQQSDDAIAAANVADQYGDAAHAQHRADGPRPVPARHRRGREAVPRQGDPGIGRHRHLHGRCDHDGDRAVHLDRLLGVRPSTRSAQKRPTRAMSSSSIGLEYLNTSESSPLRYGASSDSSGSGAVATG